MGRAVGGVGDLHVARKLGQHARQPRGIAHIDLGGQRLRRGQAVYGQAQGRRRTTLLPVQHLGAGQRGQRGGVGRLLAALLQKQRAGQRGIGQRRQRGVPGLVERPTAAHEPPLAVGNGRLQNLNAENNGRCSVGIRHKRAGVGRAGVDKIRLARLVGVRQADGRQVVARPGFARAGQPRRGRAPPHQARGGRARAGEAAGLAVLQQLAALAVGKTRDVAARKRDEVQVDARGAALGDSAAYCAVGVRFSA